MTIKFGGENLSNDNFHTQSTVVKLTNVQILEIKIIVTYWLCKLLEE